MTRFNPQQLDGKAPAQAFAFTAEGAFEKPSDRIDGLRKMAVSVLARTGSPVYHWYWGTIVHDLAGMRSKTKIAFDYRHDPDEPIGYADRFEIRDNNLYLSGELISRDVDDEAAKIMDLGPAGVPYEASIQFDPNTVVLEYLPSDMTTTVNGQEVTGPLVIVREWELLRCAFCLTGVDSGTTTEFLEAAAASQFSLNWKGTSMTKNNTHASGSQGSDIESKDAPAGAQSQPTIDLGAERAKFETELKNQLKKFTDKFGMEDGAKYFSENLSYEAALEQHVAKLQAANEETNKSKTELEAKLAAVDLGENEPVGTAGGSATKSAKWEDLFRAGGSVRTK